MFGTKRPPAPYEMGPLAASSNPVFVLIGQMTAALVTVISAATSWKSTYGMRRDRPLRVCS
jgi:hypothetical protein